MYLMCVQFGGPTESEKTVLQKLDTSRKKELDKILHKTAEYMSDGRKRPNFLPFFCAALFCLAY